jgi:hypothetical protein
MKRIAPRSLIITLAACGSPGPGSTRGSDAGQQPDLDRLPAFVYGAVYFRKTNPPPEDWERDDRTADGDGHDIFRNWFLWSAIENSPGVNDWFDYDLLYLPYPVMNRNRVVVRVAGHDACILRLEAAE